jgi:hypothetical protein
MRSLPIWQRGYRKHAMRNDDEQDRLHVCINFKVINQAKDGANSLSRGSDPCIAT